MQENSYIDDTQTSAHKSRFSIIITVILAAISVVLVLFSALVCYAAFNKGAENTAGLFGYKLFYCENDIEGTDIKKGSLVVIKNSDSDEYYEAQFLSENAVLVVEDLGGQLKQNGFYMSICIMIPFAFIFIIVLFTEIKKNHSRRAQNPISELEFKDIPEEEFVLED